MEFSIFRAAVKNQLESLMRHHQYLFLVDTPKTAMWEAYINLFPEEHRQHHNCNACRSFIQRFGRVVAIDKDTYSTVSIWRGSEEYQSIANSLHTLVTSSSIGEVFLFNRHSDGVYIKEGGHTHFGLSENLDSNLRMWTHFYAEFDDSFAFREWNNRGSTISSDMNIARQHRHLFRKLMENVSEEALDCVIDRINNNQLYRGEERLSSLNEILSLKRSYDDLSIDVRYNFCWLNSSLRPDIAVLANSAIGKLLIDLTSGTNDEGAFRSYESMMNPTNYRVTSRAASLSSIQLAEKAITELNLLDSLPRRFATPKDIAVTDALYTDRALRTNTSNSIFAQLKEEVGVNPSKMTRIPTISMDALLDTIPFTSKMEVLLESRLSPNLCTLIVPKYSDAPSILAWENGASICYKGGYGDSVKERVKEVGGLVEGKLRFSIRWYNGDDLDNHLFEPGVIDVSPDSMSPKHIWFRRKTSTSGGQLDVDMCAGSPEPDPVENIVYSHFANPPVGEYVWCVHNFVRRDLKNGGFEAEIEANNRLYRFVVGASPKDRELYEIARVHFDGKDVTIVSSCTSPTTGDESIPGHKIWGLSTNVFHPVRHVMYSPNYWNRGGNNRGNKHLIFMLDECRCDDDRIKGFIPEFLRGDLQQHRRTLQAVASKMDVINDGSPQLSGLGFSSTSDYNFIVRLTDDKDKVKLVRVASVA